MSVESGGSLAASGSPSNSLSMAASLGASTTRTAVRSTAMGVAYEAGDPRHRVTGSPERTPATASALLRTVKQDVESEEEGRKRRGKGGGGGGKREKTNGKFLNANKHLMKKGILEFESRAGDSDRSSTFPHSSSTPPQQNNFRPLSVYTTSPPNTFSADAAPTDVRPGVLVAGPGGSMRRVFRHQSPTDVLPYPGNSVQLALSPDSGYGNTPDGMRHSDQQPQAANTNALNLPRNEGSSRSNSERTSSSDSVGVTVTIDSGVGGESSTSFCGAHMSVPPQGKFGIGEAVTTAFPAIPSPPLPSNGGTPLESETGRDRHHNPASPSHSITQTVNKTPGHLTSTANSPRHYNPYSINFPLSPGPKGETQVFQFSNPQITTTSMTHGVSTPSLSPLPPTSPRHNSHHTPSNDDRPRSANYRSRDGEAPGNSRRQTSPARDWRDKARQTRSRSQPMVASLTLSKLSSDPHKDSSSGSGQKDFFQVTDELSRENSHFSLSEALLTVIEQYKANTTEARQEALRGERDQQATPPPDPMDAAPNSDLYATSPPPRSWGSLSSIATEDSVDEFSLQKSTPKVSLVDLTRNAGSGVQSAESTAQRLLQFIAAQYSGVESEDVGNTSTVLTLPVDFLFSLRQDEDLQKSVTTSSPPTRGSKDWAPPRAQIIFHIKTPPRNVMKHLAAQGYRCTGCGMRQDPSQARHFRFCHYTGKYFCQKCHSNALSIVPAYVLHRWSFKKYYVSNFAHDLLERIHYEPVFDLNNINPQIYTTVPLLAQARDLRMQLVAVKKYLKTCRQAQSLTATFDGYIPWTADVHTYSIDDFLQIKLKLRYLRSLLQDSIKHVKSCPLCQGKGFVCEFCNQSEIIFPFELKKVTKCTHCLCCFHKECFNGQPCPRCIRMRHHEKSFHQWVYFGCAEKHIFYVNVWLVHIQAEREEEANTTQ